jgi:hypothetical protein
MWIDLYTYTCHNSLDWEDEATVRELRAIESLHVEYSPIWGILRKSKAADGSVAPRPRSFILPI